MTTPISTDNDSIQSGGSSAQNQLDGTMSGNAAISGSGTAHPRLSAAVDDARSSNRRAADRNRDGIDRTRKDSQGKTDIDEDGASGLNGVNGVGGLMLGALGAAGSELAKSGGQGGGMPQQMMAAPAAALPQFSAPTTGQSFPGALSNPAVAQLISRLISGDTSAVGSGGLLTSAGIGGGGSGTVGPSGTGRNQFEQRMLALARQVVAAQIPYTWGGGTVNGPSQGIRDGGAADAAGDYRKTGFDCSSLARYLVYQSSGIEIPRTSQAQFGAGMTVSPSDARPGDLLFPHSAGVPPTHVMVYVGEGKVVEAQQSGTNIMFSDVRPGVFKRYVNVG